MGDLLGILIALAVPVIPLLIAWFLLGCGDPARRRHETLSAREKMPR